MKTHSLRSLAVAFSILTSQLSFAQIPNCQPGTSQVQIESGQVKTLLLNQGDMFHDPVAKKASFTWPKNDPFNRSLIYSGSLWFGGTELGTSNFLTAVQTNRDSVRNFWPGPIDAANPNGTSNLICSVWNRHFKVDRSHLDAFLSVLQSNTLPLASGIIPEPVLLWPGKGNTWLKALATAQGLTDLGSFDLDLAPFQDVNSNGIYDPQNGDYPDLGNRSSMVWWVINDIGNQKVCYSDPTVMPGIGLEFQVMASTYPGINQQQYLENSIFLDYKIINKGTKTLEDSYLGLFLDFDIANGGDDFLQCHVMKNLAFAFDGDIGSVSSANNYGPNAPALAFKVLDAPGPLAENDGFDNNRNGIADEAGEKKIMAGFTYFNFGSSPINGDPKSISAFTQLLKGKWKNGSDLVYGGSGLGPVGVTTPFAFPGSSDSIGLAFNGTVQNPVLKPKWTENNSGNSPGDRRGLIRSGPFTFAPGQSVHYATVSLVGSGGTVQENISHLYNISDSLENFRSTLLTSNAERKIPNVAAIVFPNPASENIRINGGNDISHIRITDLQGKEIYQDQAYVSFGDIDVRSFSKGVYLVQVLSKSGSSTLKLVVTK